MKKIIIYASVTAAAILSMGFAQGDNYIPALACLGYMLFVFFVNTRKPRAATRGKEDVVPMRPLYTYDNTVGVWKQDADERWRV